MELCDVAPVIGVGFDCGQFNLYGVNITWSIPDVLSAPFKSTQGGKPWAFDRNDQFIFPFCTLAQRSLASSVSTGTISMVARGGKDHIDCR